MTLKSLLRVLLLVLLLAAHGDPALAFQNYFYDQPEILAAYNAAIYDSSVYKFSNLRPLVPLKFDSASKTVTVVALTDFKYTVGETSLPMDKDLWVTADPEVKTICQNFTGDLALRLRQLLGLHPSKPVSRFVVIKVKEGSIFRPTINPNTTTTLPCSYPVTVNCGGEAFAPDATQFHINWIAKKAMSTYVISESYWIPVGYPWTRLGYTYDWKPGANKYGASEYVIPAGSSFTVTQVISYQDYCRPLK